MYILIHCDTLQFVATGDYRALCEQADKDFATGWFIIGPVDQKSTYSDFTESELRTLYKNTTGKDPAESKWELLQACMLQAGIVPATKHKIPTAPIAPPWQGRDSSEPVIISRPSAGTATGRVWAIADELVESKAEIIPATWDSKQLKLAVVDQCIAEGINPATAQVQFGKWKKHQESL